ncbi:MAG: hypothetical protein IKV69_01785, partial [Clostridia bacterium]|nr:hypothetical protein [Clostridia bacterium]
MGFFKAKEEWAKIFRPKTLETDYSTPKNFFQGFYKKKHTFCKICQYNRSVRQNIPFDKNIQELDMQA